MKKKFPVAWKNCTNSTPRWEKWKKKPMWRNMFFLCVSCDLKSRPPVFFFPKRIAQMQAFITEQFLDIIIIIILIYPATQPPDAASWVSYFFLPFSRFIRTFLVNMNSKLYYKFIHGRCHTIKYRVQTIMELQFSESQKLVDFFLNFCTSPKCNFSCERV